jgi:hypothetical protein
MKRSIDKQIFLCVAFLIGAGCLSLSLLVLPADSIRTTLKAFPYALGASLMYFCYQISVSKAYEEGDISLVYPLTILGYKTPLSVSPKS